MFRKYQLIVPELSEGQFGVLHKFIRESRNLPVSIGRPSGLNGYGNLGFPVVALVGKKKDIREVVRLAYYQADKWAAETETKQLIDAIEPEGLLDHGKTKLSTAARRWFSPFRKKAQVGLADGSFGSADIFQAEDALFETIQEGVRPTGMVRKATRATLSAPLVAVALKAYRT